MTLKRPHLRQTLKEHEGQVLWEMLLDLELLTMTS